MSLQLGFAMTSSRKYHGLVFALSMLVPNMAATTLKNRKLCKGMNIIRQITWRGSLLDSLGHVLKEEFNRV